MALEPYYRDGDVTLYHGDCLEHSNVWTSADALITDPPYGIALPVKSDKYHHNGFGKKQRGGGCRERPKPLCARCSYCRLARRKHAQETCGSIRNMAA